MIHQQILHRNYSIHFLIGLSLSLTVVLTIINLSIARPEFIPFVFDEPEDLLNIKQVKRTSFKKKVEVIKLPEPAPKPKKNAIIIPIENDIKLLDMDVAPADDEVIDLDPDTMAHTPAPLPPPLPDEPVIADDLPFVHVEQMPRFPGCEEVEGSDKEKELCARDKLMAFIYNNIKYPALARENNIQGMVVAQFVVDTQGEISEIEIVRDIGGGCGHTVQKVVQSMNDMKAKWSPGRQRGRPVKVLYTLPVKFELGN